MSDRTLHIVPVIHTEADLGALAERVRATTDAALGEGAADKKAESVDKLWDAIETWCDALDVAPPGTRTRAICRLYQDGLPVCGKEMPIARDLAAQGSRNHALLVALAQRGAVLMGTEDAELVLEEYQITKTALEHGDRPDEERLRDLLLRRDRAIAARIDQTLRPGEAAVCFVGMLHDVAEHLPLSIKTEAPFTSRDHRDRRRS
jgi:hypothetical protein